MRLLLILLLFCSISAMAVDHTVTSAGTGTFLNIAEVNAHTFVAGDRILFNKGETFYGSLTVSQSGTSGSPIIIGSYGTGANPILTGFTTVSTWTDLGSNIWESTSAVSTLSTCNMVVINGVNTAMGRYPNANAANGGYLTFQSHSGLTSITSSSLTGTPNWTGAEVVIRALRYVVDRKVITSQSTSTLNFATGGSTPRDNSGFFIQNDVRTLDAQNEWHYNTSTKKLRIYSTSQPTNVKVASIDRLLTVTGDYITVDGVDFIGSNDISVYNTSSSVDHFVFQNCNVLFAGNEAMYFRSSYLTVENNTFSDSNYKGVNLSDSDNVIFRNNTIQRNGLYVGNGTSTTDNATAFVCHNTTTALIEYNHVLNVGYNGIDFYGHSITVKNNFVDTFCSVLDDGGGIYTYTGGQAVMTNCKIEGNVVINGMQSTNGTGFTTSQSMGIYLDDNSKNVEVVNNTAANCAGVGIYLHNPSYTNTHGNTVYNTATNGFENAQIHLKDDESPSGTTTNNDIQDNLFVNPTSKTGTAYFRTVEGTVLNQNGIVDYNYYIQITNPTLPIWVNTSVVPYTNYSLASWRTFSGSDVHSNLSPLTVTSVDDFEFIYNATGTAITPSLSQPKVDVYGTKYATSITIQPYTSAVLFVDPNPLTSGSKFAGNGTKLIGNGNKIIRTK